MGAARAYMSSGLLFRGKTAKAPPVQVSNPAVIIATPIRSNMFQPPTVHHSTFGLTVNPLV
jgi:hypothetical protein